MDSSPAGTDGGGQPRRRSAALRAAAWSLILVSLAVSAAVVVFAVIAEPTAGPDVGELDEPSYTRPLGVAAVMMSDATEEWGLSEIDLRGSDALSGGLGLVDVDGDGWRDLLAVNGHAIAAKWNGRKFTDPVDLGVDDGLSIVGRDLDGDNEVDLVVARRSSPGRVLWSAGRFLSGSDDFTASEIGTSGPSSLIPVDLDADGSPELIRLSRDRDNPTDRIYGLVDAGSRSYRSLSLLDSEGLSLAAAVADIDRDGRVDIWITRDVGWDSGGDGLYSRTGLGSEWEDIALSTGAALAIDGMGVALGDLTGDGEIDAYVSDIGDNEILARSGSSFSTLRGTGAARIRPPGQPAAVVSSSWGAGIADLNLDGRADIVVSGGGFPDSAVRNKIPGTSVAEAEPPALFLGLGDGKFVDDWPSVVAPALRIVGRSLVVGDVDADGDADLIFLTRQGQLRALRNESTAPSVTIEVDESCGDGVVVEVRTAGGLYSVVVPGHSYGGVHPRQVVVGTGGQAGSVSLRPPGQPEQSWTFAQSEERLRSSFNC